MVHIFRSELILTKPLIPKLFDAEFCVFSCLPLTCCWYQWSCWQVRWAWWRYNILYCSSLNLHITVVEGLVCLNDPRSYVVWGYYVPGGVLAWQLGPRWWARLKLVHEIIKKSNKTRICIAPRLVLLDPTLKSGVEDLPTGSSRAPPGMVMLVCLPVASSPTGKFVRGPLHCGLCLSHDCGKWWP